MVQILVLILLMFLIARGIGFLTHVISNARMRGKRLQKMIDEGRLDADVVDVIERARAGDASARLTKEQRRSIRLAQVAERDEYLESFHLTLYQLIYIFVIASMLGLVLEEIWMYVNFGIKESRVGMVWGPFSPLYGFGAVLLTVVLWKLRHRPTWQIWAISALLGTALEQFTGMAMEIVAHAESWNYLGLPDHITKWTAWRFVIIWGFLGLIWCRTIMPEMLYKIGTVHEGHGRLIGVTVLAVFLVADIVVTVTCFTRNTERAEGIPAHNPFEAWVDQHYDEQFIQDRFENLTVVSSPTITGEE